MTRNVLRLCTAVVLSVCVVGGANGQAPDPPVCERSQVVQDEIILHLGVSNCSQVTTTAQLESIRTDVGGGNFDLDDATLQEGDLNDLVRIQDLAILRLINRSLPDGIFDDLVGLGTIDLHFGQIESLQGDLFRHSNLLEVINLQDNQLETLPSGLFEGLDQLDRLFLGQNPLSLGLPVDIFDGLSLERLWISDLVAMIGALPEEVLLTAAESSTTIDLMPAFIRSPDSTNAIIQNANNNYEITVADTAVATAQLDDHELTIEVAGSGETTVTIVGRRSGDTAMQRIRVVVLFPEPPVCERTPQVRDAIVAAIDGVSDCNDANDNRQLTAISNLDLSDSGTTAIRRFQQSHRAYRA